MHTTRQRAARIDARMPAPACRAQIAIPAVARPTEHRLDATRPVAGVLRERRRGGALLFIGIALLACGVVGFPQAWHPAESRMQTPTLLLLAAGIGDVEGVRRALNDGVSPDSTDYGVTALSVTFSPDVARLLISRGARLSGISDRGTPLSQAVATNRIEVMRVLLAAGADPNEFKPRDGLSPLETAKLQHNQKAVELLRQYGAVDTSSGDARER